MKEEQGQYGIGSLFAISGVIAFIFGFPNWLAFISFCVGVYSLYSGRKTENEVQEKQNLISRLLSEKLDLREDLNETKEQANSLQSELKEEKHRKDKIRAEKRRKNQRLSNLKRVLRQKGIDTDYLVEKYDNALYAPVMVFTHYNAPNHNSKKRGGDNKREFRGP